MNLHHLPLLIRQPIVMTTWAWGKHQFTISVDGTKRTLTDGSPRFPAVLTRAIDAWCQSNFEMSVIEYLEKMFGDQYK